MARKQSIPTKIDLGRLITEGLLATASNPSVFAYKPQEQQKPFHASKKTGRLALGGNRSGKTVSGGCELAMVMCGLAEGQRFKPPVRCRAIGVDFDNGVDKIIIPELKRWIPKSFLKDGSWDESYHKGSRTLSLTNGSTCEFMSYDQDQDKFAGTSRHYIWFDEEPPENIFNECMLRLVDTGGQWWMTMTPLIDMTWTLERLYEPSADGTNPNIDLFMFETVDNPHVTAENMEIYTEGMDESEKAARQKGEFFTYTGAIYKKVIQDAILEPIIGTDRWPLLWNEWKHFGMLDAGIANPTAFLLGCYDKEGRIIIYAEHYKQGLTVKENAYEIKSLMEQLQVTNKIEYMVADPAIRNKDPIVGYSIQMAYGQEGLYFALGNNDVIAGISRVYQRFQNKQLFITKDCPKTVWEHTRYRWQSYANKKTEIKNNPKEAPMKKNDHACDALRYGVVSRPSIDGEIDMPKELVLNGSVAVSPVNPLFDTNLTRMGKTMKLNDPHLGSDW